MVTDFNTEFSINGLQIAYGDLSEVAYSLVKEGEPFEREIGDFLLDWISDSPDVLQRTSGSTGMPKEIFLPKEGMVKSARLTGELLGLGEGTRAVLCLPVSSIAGKMMLVRALVLGWKLTMVAPDRRPLWAISGPVDFVAMSPMQLRASLKDLHRVGMVLVGGAPVSGQLREELSGRKTVVYESYGMSETASHIALRKINPGSAAEQTGDLPPFKALPGVQLEQDKSGCLIVKVPFISEAAIHTHDLVSMTDTDAFNWMGRADHIVNSAGVKLSPELLEAKLEPVMKQRFFLTGIPDEELGEKLVLVVEGKKEDDLLSELKKKSALEKYEIPKAVYFLKAFKETESGKVSRAEITKNLI
jgi:O-succinylbenzoic acid--CoA ligase